MQSTSNLNKATRQRKRSYCLQKTDSTNSNIENVDSVVGDANLTSGSNQAMAAYTAAISNTLTKVKI